jgi:hypothetical protein
MTPEGHGVDAVLRFVVIGPPSPFVILGRTERSEGEDPGIHA